MNKFRYFVLTLEGHVLSKEGDDSTPDETNLFDSLTEARAAIAAMGEHGHSKDRYVIVEVNDILEA